MFIVHKVIYNLRSVSLGFSYCKLQMIMVSVFISKYHYSKGVGKMDIWLTLYFALQFIISINRISKAKNVRI